MRGPIPCPTRCGTGDWLETTLLNQSVETDPKQESARLRPRQRLLLAFFAALGGRIGRTDFQKLLFLYCQELDKGRPYQFVPYQYGAFSFNSYADCRKLIDRGFLVEDGDSGWRLTTLGENAAAYGQDDGLTRFVGRYRRLRGDALIRHTYQRFPYYAICSEVAGSVLAGDRMTLRRIDQVRPRVRSTALLTIGYQGRSLETYLNLLIGAGATILCDVRRNAISRVYGFSKSTLDSACSGVGIRYVHIPTLGISSERRRGLRSESDYLRLFAEYETADLPQRPAELAEIKEWIRSGEAVALTCFERDSADCHRGRVAAAIERMAKSGLSTEHL